MSYKNGKDILPDNLLRELQKYIQGDLIYIPKSETRAGWGEKNGTRQEIIERNREIYDLYKKGINIDKLICTFNLSEDSIRKIINKLNKDKKQAIRSVFI